MSLVMPELDRGVLGRRAEIVAALRAIVPGEGVIDSATEMRPFESDGLTAYRALPMVVVLPSTVEQVSQVLRYCHEHKIKVVPRGAGTSLSGGSLPLEDGVLLGMSKFNRVLEIDYPNRVAVVQPGVTNLGVTKAVEGEGFYYAPDPSSQIACSIGGNIAENSGGVHCLKYGMTMNNVLGVEMVLITGEVLRIGGKYLDADGYDLLSVIIGSEGLLGVVTEVTVRILKKPETARAVLVGFPTSEAAGDCVAKIIGAGIIPGGMEMMDKPAIEAAEAFVHAGYPLDVEALLIVELDGPKAEVDSLLEQVEQAREGMRLDGVARIEFGRRAREILGGAQSRVSRRRPHIAGLLLHGRNDPARKTADRADAHARAFRKIQIARRQRLPCRRRQSASAHSVRCEYRGRIGARGKFRQRYFAPMRRSRRRADRRAWRRRRKARPHARDVQRGGSRAADALEMRLRCRRPAQSRQGISETSPLRRTRPHAYSRRQGAVSRSAQVLMTDTFKPRDEKEIVEAVAWAVSGGKKLEVIGRGSKRAIGRAAQFDTTLDVSALSGVSLYEPEELVFSAQAGTPLNEIEKLLEKNKQEFAFEPMDLGPVLGGKIGDGTLGGLLSVNFSGPRRIKAGNARDHALGIKAVSGRGEAFKAGGRVVKNVTGYDLPKLLAGSWGTLAVMTEITLKVLPVAEDVETVLALGLSDARAIEAMSAAMGSACDVSAAAHLPQKVAAKLPVKSVAGGNASVTAFRLEGIAPSIAYRREKLERMLKPFGALAVLKADESRALWRAVRDAIPFAEKTKNALWRISVTPSAGAKIGGAIAAATGARDVLRLGGRIDVGRDARTKIRTSTPCAPRSAVKATRFWCALLLPPARARRCSARSTMALRKSCAA